MALLIVLAGAELGEGFPLLDGRVSVTVGFRRGSGYALSDCGGGGGEGGGGGGGRAR